MLETLGAKILSGIVTLSMFLFSSYTGNDPAFTAIRGSMGRSYIQLSTRLAGAFDNDFPDVFRSGTKITVYYKVNIRSKGKLVASREFQNSVQYDSRQNIYTVRLSGTDRGYQTSDYRLMVNDLATMECSMPIQSSWGYSTVEFEAWLPTVYFDKIDKKVNLMVLWNYSRPKLKSEFNLRYTY